MKLRFTPRALDNIIDIGSYVRSHNPAASKRVRAAIYDTLQNIILFPFIGRHQTTEGVRKLVTRKYPYLVYYMVDEVAEEIVVLSVKHQAQEREHKDN